VEAAARRAKMIMKKRSGKEMYLIYRGPIRYLWIIEKL
jgi:hypothetical protein